MKFKDYKEFNHKMITIVDSEFYPDYLDQAKFLYQGILEKFEELLFSSNSSDDFLLKITEVNPPAQRIQLLRIFRRYVSPDTSVEMLKRKISIPSIIVNFGDRFREIEEVQRNFYQRGVNDEAIFALLYEYKDRGQKGYDLTEAFFKWFEYKFKGKYDIDGPIRGGRDIILSSILQGYNKNTPSDFIIKNNEGELLAIGFARYDSDRGGAQEDDRIKGNRDSATEILKYCIEKNKKIKIIYLNDGPGLLLGSMWNDYSDLESDFPDDFLMVTTLKMLDNRLTQEWLEV